MSIKTAVQLLNSLGFRISFAQAQKFMKSFDLDEDGRLDFPEFVKLMRKTRTHPILTYLFSNYASADEKMSVKELCQFYEEEQKEKLR